MSLSSGLPARPRRTVWRRTRKALRVPGLVVAVFLATAIGMRLYDIRHGPPLAVWHTCVPEELSRGAVVYPERFAHDWNLSSVLEPDAEPAGVAVLLHGLTDSPYSLRHIAAHYRDAGDTVVAIRLPGHGTAGGLTDATWEDWSAAARLAVREARRRVPAPRPLHIVGFSNGGALALMYAMDAIDGSGPARPDRLVLISPMIGITQFARVAGLAGLPAILPAFAKAAWLSIVPEFNPFKYNSFPVNAAPIV